MDTKTCTKCGEAKALTEFYAKANGKNGLAPTCKACEITRAAEWRAKNSEKCRARLAKWRAENPEKLRAQVTKWRANNPERNRTNCKKWGAENPEKVIAFSRRSRDNLSPSYVGTQLGIPVAQLTPELLEAKRQQLEIHRLKRQLNATLKDLDHEK